MIQKKFNALTSGCSGKIGDLVFRQRGNRLVIAKLSGKPHKKGTRAQQAQRNRFAEANDYATTVQYDQKRTSLYKKRSNANVNVRNLAVGDYLKAPVINDIDMRHYKGRPGNEIIIDAKDDFMVKAVTVSIYNSDNELLETGPAVVSPVKYKGRKTWAQMAVYTTTVAHAGTVRIVVNASDIPGNVCTEEVYAKLAVYTKLPSVMTAQPLNKDTDAVACISASSEMSIKVPIQRNGIILTLETEGRNTVYLLKKAEANN